ncbi:MAG TPA: ABC transporter ATP-binding protein [Kofleriaceae bacterium]|nr:ABC transporter ATP-binding protein [Kofleriaceae bacterium]
MIDAVVIRGLTKRFGTQRVLAGVDLELRAGRLCALLGPNGAGKSTLLGILSTLVRPTAGEVSFRAGDRALGGGGELRRIIGVLAHDSFLYGGLTAVENLLFYARLYEVADAEARAEALLDEVGLEPEARHRPVRTFSRGMVQRVALARALLHDPRVLLLDEPLTGLDRGGAASLVRTLESAVRRGCVVLVVSHDLEALAGVTTHLAILRRGRLQHEGHSAAGFSYQELKELYHRHAD